VLDRGEAWLGNGAEAILWAYPDAQLTLSMGREASLCVPVRLGGRTLGLLSMSAEKDRYNATDLANLKLVAALLAPAMERACAA
jgi:GAF domain-containing protein